MRSTRRSRGRGKGPPGQPPDRVVPEWVATIGKLRLTASFADGVAQSGFVPLPISLHHAAVAGELPPHHRDPFDRMLVAQARLERLTLVSHDRRLEPYGAAIIWA